MSFENLNLHPLILKAVIDSGYTTPTPVQAQAIPELIAGHDIMASAQTGTGKTAAFMLPALHRLATPSKVHSRGPRVLVLTPTRELALQVSEAAAKYGKHLPRVRVVSILGGMPYPLQNKLLSQPVDILVATPGRLIDHIQRGRIDFSRLEMLVLDEADRMLDMGFIDDVERIASATPATRQTLLFSATLDSAIDRVAARLLKAPKRIQIATQQARLDNIEQRLHYVDDISHKNRLLDHLLRDITLKQAIVFTATKRDADMLADNLSAQGHEAAALHGDMNQRDRTRTLTKLRHGGLRVLVATDVAARGIDVVGITHVINFDLPKFAEDYVHRIGRTGRAGASGIAVSFASGKDGVNLKKIERFTGQRIDSHVIPGLEPRFKPRPATGGPSRGTPSVAHKRNRTWANDSGRPASGSNNANGNWDNSRSRSFNDNRENTRGNAGGNTRSHTFGNSGAPSPYFRSK
ncbi:superfamily II DNA/RNA helicase [Nitrosospira sp. Nsp5]|uniref:Superfamily II DNA and RNA helicase n=1 Tax=Nitrosospira multiformis TaxID=1231 RepID=A0ABY0TDC8_9PROT|nr:MULTISPECIES: DEAD/DEAH box helicase [Nitrosospira]PTR05782.1 superfamily II DNA/RNA helicase [Nitrosospira sp. Nsp5]SDQ62795.1 Superfamily II DNA and RNA helicase [Nitrosospira multiformis]